MKVTIKQGDLTKMNVDAIVNAANSHGWMGGGVAGVIKRIGGQEIEDEAVEQAPIPVGEARLTTAGKLPAKYVIHAPTMENPAEITTPEKVAKATLACLKCADKKKLSTLAIPGMGTGVGRVSPDDAARAMVNVIKRFKPQNLKEIILTDIDADMVRAFRKYMG